jgi:cytochrome c heme-lyase
MAKPTADSQESCPVDPASRAVWLKQAGKPESPPTASSLLSSEGCDSSTIDQTPSPNRRPRLPIPGFQTKAALAHDREVSTIPRTAAGTIAPGSSPLANNEQESGKDEQTGNWIYPSEQMFFSAMRRKNYDPRVEDMQSIIPIHNAVNERAWKEIKDWESGWGSEK